jgi:hypothetical protein
MEEVPRKKERGDETQFATKIGGKPSLHPVISFCKISLSVTHLSPHYVKTGRSQTVKFCIVHHDISSGWQLWGSATFFLYSEHACFGFYIRHP